MVVIAEGTRRLLGNLFEFEDLGATDLKGIAGPCEPGRRCQRVRRKAASRRCTRRGTALVGREEELELLLPRWSRAKTGEGQVVLLSGEAGIGKSRPHGCAAGTTRSRTAHAVALLLLPAAHRQRVLYDHRPNGRRRMRSQNVVSTQELLVGGSGGDLNRLPRRQARTPRVKLAPGDSCAALTHRTHKRILSNTSTAPRLRRVCPPKS
jgi:hypothetical protein